MDGIRISFSLTAVAVLTAFVADGQAEDADAVERKYGYSMRLPDGWLRVPRAEAASLPGAVRAALDDVPIDRDCVEFLIAVPTPARRLAVCQVVVKPSPRAKSLGDWERLHMHGNPPDWYAIQHEGGGLTAFYDVAGQWRVVDGRRLFVTDITCSKGGSKAARLKGRQVAWYAGGNVVHLFALAHEEDFAASAEAFDAIFASVLVSPWWRIWPMPLYLALFAMLMAAVVGILIWRRRRIKIQERPAAAPQSS